jgi:anti-anti-sigma factor
MSGASASKWSVGDRMVLSPREPLIAGGAAEAFERHLQQISRSGYRQLVIDLSGVQAIDSAGIRALVRGHTSALRLGGRVRLAAPSPAVRHVLELLNLLSVFEIYESTEAARIASLPWPAIRVAAIGAILCGGLVLAGLKWPIELSAPSGAESLATGKNGTPAVIPLGPLQPFIQLIKLVVATLIGLLVTTIHKPAARERSSSMEQAQTLLCVSGTMMMIIIGDSLARAFGIAGAASIIRFRTPVEDPKDVTILFLLMGLGMSVGLGAFAVAGLGTGFLCITLVLLSRMSRQRARIMSVELLASGRQFPTTHVEGVFARNQIVFEPREISSADDVTVRYHTWLDQHTSLDDLSVQLMIEGAGVKAVTWEQPKQRELV